MHVQRSPTKTVTSEEKVTVYSQCASIPTSCWFIQVPNTFSLLCSSKPNLKIIQGSLSVTVALPQNLHLFFLIIGSLMILCAFAQFLAVSLFLQLTQSRFWCYAHCVSPSALEDRSYSSWKSDGVTLEARDSQINRGSILQLVYSAQI